MFKCVLNDRNFHSADPLPSVAELTEWYAQKYYQTADQRQTTYQGIYTDQELAHKRLIADQMLYAIEQVAGPGDGRSFIDVGCGEGFLVKSAHDHGWSAEGLDFNGEPARHWNPEIGDKVTAGNAYELLDAIVAEGRQYQVCTLANVLEHVIDPWQLLNTLKRILLPGGVLVITVPNDYSTLQKVLIDEGYVDREYWFSPPSHLHYFDAPSLTRLCTDAGYQVCDLYAAFPVEFFLLHSGSNYVRHPDQGKDAHRARVTVDLLMAQQGMAAFHQLYRSLAGCHMGRQITVVLRNGAA